jgi:hypothetical protein
MVIAGELNGLDGAVCCDCGANLHLMVCHSMAGYYLGYFCGECGPYSRESDYFEKREDAQRALRGEINRRLRG